MRCVVAGKKAFGISVVHRRILSQRRQTHKRYQSLNLKYGIIQQIVLCRLIMHVSVLNLISTLTDFPPEHVPYQEDVFSLPSYVIFIILILRQAWKGRTAVRSPSGFCRKFVEVGNRLRKGWFIIRYRAFRSDLLASLVWWPALGKQDRLC